MTSDANSENKTVFVRCPENGQAPLTGGANIDGGDGFVALTESRQAFPPSYPDVGWLASAIEVNGGTSEDWSLNVTLVCQKAKP